MPKLRVNVLQLAKIWVRAILVNISFSIFKIMLNHFLEPKLDQCLILWTVCINT